MKTLITKHSNKLFASKRRHSAPPILCATTYSKINPGSFHKTGGNALHSVMDFNGAQHFVKIQAAANKDPIVNEAIVLSIMNARERMLWGEMYTGEHIYPTISYTGMDKGSDEVTRLVLGMELIEECMTMGQFIDMYRYKIETDVVFSGRMMCVVGRMLWKHIVICTSKVPIEIPFSHNDCHMNNIMVACNVEKVLNPETNTHEILHVPTRAYLIDFGRAWIRLGERKTHYKGIVEKVLDDFGFKRDPENDNKHLDLEILTDNMPILQGFQIRDPVYGYLCDVASICVNVLPLCKGWVWPPWFAWTMGRENGKITMGCKDAYEYFYAEPEEKKGRIMGWFGGKPFIPVDYVYIFYDALAWLAIICRCVFVGVKNEVSDTFTIAELKRTILFPNGVFRKSCYDKAILYNKSLYNKIKMSAYRCLLQ
jgi:hypothetical protein